MLILLAVITEAVMYFTRKITSSSISSSILVYTLITGSTKCVYTVCGSCRFWFCFLSLFLRTNEDDFLPVDLAAMLNHESIVRMLLEKGAKDSAKCTYIRSTVHVNITMVTTCTCTCTCTCRSAFDIQFITYII